MNIDAAVLVAQDAGHPINRSVVYKALKGNHAKRPTDATLKAFAAVFGIPVTELRDLVGFPTGELGPYRPPAYADQLNRDQRKALDNLIRTIVDVEKVGTIVPITKKRPHKVLDMSDEESTVRGVAKEGEVEEPEEFD